MATRQRRQRRRAWTASDFISRSAMPANASYSRRTTRRPSLRTRVVPRNTTTAPAFGSRTARARRSMEMGVRPTRSTSAPAHGRKERDLVVVGQPMRRSHVLLVDREAHVEAAELGAL